MNKISEETKRTIDALSLEELLYEVNLGSRSRFRRDKQAYVKTRLKLLQDQGAVSEGTTFSIFGVSVPVKKSAAIALLLVSTLCTAWWNWEEIAKRVGVKSSAALIEGELVALSQSWKLCINSSGKSVCTPAQVVDVKRRATELLARATELTGEDRRDLSSKATQILDATATYVLPYPSDGPIPQFQDLEDLKRKR